MVIIGDKEGGAPLLLLIIALHIDFATLQLFSLCVFIITIQSLNLCDLKGGLLFYFCKPDLQRLTFLFLVILSSSKYISFPLLIYEMACLSENLMCVTALIAYVSVSTFPPTLEERSLAIHNPDLIWIRQYSDRAVRIKRITTFQKSLRKALSDGIVVRPFSRMYNSIPDLRPGSPSVRNRIFRPISVENGLAALMSINVLPIWAVDLILCQGMTFFVIRQRLHLHLWIRAQGSIYWVYPVNFILRSKYW